MLKNSLMAPEEEPGVAGGGAPTAPTSLEGGEDWLFEDTEEEKVADFDAGEPAKAPEPAPPPAPTPEPAPPAVVPAEPAPAPVVAPVEPPAVVSAPAPAPVVAPPVAPVVEVQQPVAPVQPAVPAAPQKTAQEVEAEQNTRREQYRGSLESHYKGLLTEEDNTALLTEPATVLPKLAAEMHMRALESTMSGVMQVIPQMVRDVLKADVQARANEDQFFGKWKELNTPQGKMAVGRIMQTYIAFNPQATRDVVIQEVGAAAMHALGLGGAQVPVPAVMQPPPPPPPAGAGSGAPSLPKPAGPAPGSQASFFEEIASEGRGH